MNATTRIDEDAGRRPELKRDELLDEEVRRIVERSDKEVLALLEENRRRLDSLVAALLQHETLDEADAYAAAGVERKVAPAADSLATAATSRLGD